MAVPECASNEEIPRVANLSELDFHEEYFLKAQYLGILFRISHCLVCTECQTKLVCFSGLRYQQLGYLVE
jgi:hypothetical protein